MRSATGAPHLRLLEYRHNLLDTESFSFHGILLPLPRGDYAGNSPSNRYQNRGADQFSSRALPIPLPSRFSLQIAELSFFCTLK